LAKRRSRRVRAFVLVGLCFLLPTSCQSADEAWRRIESSGTLRLGIDPSFPPFEFAQADGLAGLDVDLAHAVASDLGLKAEFIHLSYDGLYDALGTGQVDVLISALIISPERTRDFAYGQSYFDAGEMLFYSAGNQGIEEIDALSGGALAVELGAQGHVEATIWSRRIDGLRLQTYNSSNEALQAVVDGKADAALVDAVSGRLFMMQQPALQRSHQQVTSEPFAMVVRRQDTVLLDRLNDSLERLSLSGRLEGIVATWLGD
jgi:polar amino acid transport system substrate-binding protein